MKKFLYSVMLCGMGVLAAASVAMAAEGEAAAGAAGNILAMAAFITCGAAITLASATGALAQSKAIVAALKGIARNPGAAGKITTPLIIGLAMIESLVIYALVISLILVFKF